LRWDFMWQEGDAVSGRKIHGVLWGISSSCATDRDVVGRWEDEFADFDGRGTGIEFRDEGGCDFGCERFDEATGFVGSEGGNPFRDCGVIDRAGDVVVHFGKRACGFQYDVDFDLLGRRAFVVRHTDPSGHAQALDGNPIHGLQGAPSGDR